jgi:hypothetical protein
VSEAWHWHPVVFLGQIWGHLALPENETPPPMALSDKSVVAAKPAAKPYKMSNGEDLYVEVFPSGSKYGRQKYRIAYKERRAALGVYPEVSLKLARDGAIDVKRPLCSGTKQTCAKRLQLHNALVLF